MYRMRLIAIALLLVSGSAFGQEKRSLVCYEQFEDVWPEELNKKISQSSVSAIDQRLFELGKMLELADNQAELAGKKDEAFFYKLLYLKSIIFAVNRDETEAGRCHYFLIEDESCPQALKAWAAYDLGCTYMDDKQHKDAQECFQKSMKWGLERASVKLADSKQLVQDAITKGKRYYEEDRYFEAVCELEFAFNNGQKQVANDIAYAYAMLGNFERLLEWQRIVFSDSSDQEYQEPQTAQNARLRGRALLVKDILAEAFPELEKVD